MTRLDQFGLLPIMAGRDPAICRRTSLDRVMAGSSPTMTGPDRNGRLARPRTYPKPGQAARFALTRSSNCSSRSHSVASRSNTSRTKLALASATVNGSFMAI